MSTKSRGNKTYASESGGEDILANTYSSSFAEKSTAQSNHQFTTAFDREFHARLGRFCALSPASLAGAYFDWYTHLSISPGKKLQLAESALRKYVSLVDYTLWTAMAIKTDCCIDPVEQDRRFAYKGWETYPFNVYQQAFLLTAQWWDEATRTVRGVSQHHSDILPFLTRQYLDTWSPLNFALTNPQVVEDNRTPQWEKFSNGCK